jgi:hypothetical protein
METLDFGMWGWELDLTIGLAILLTSDNLLTQVELIGFWNLVWQIDLDTKLWNGNK